VIHGRGFSDVLAAVPLLLAVKQAHETRKTAEWVKLIEANRSLTWEMLPSEALAVPAVWDALLNTGLPLGALLRNLGRLTRLEVIKPMSANTKAVVKRLTDTNQLANARIHPVNILVALRTYASGHGARSAGQWNPVAAVTDALDAAFYAAFPHVEPAGKRTMLGIDVSGSMSSPVSGLPLQCREAAGAMALVTAATEPEHMIMGFAHKFIELGISPRQRLDDAISAVYRQDFGATDCAVPMLYATEHNLQIDHFGIFTDNETWFGSMHPHQALQRYREQSGIDARLSVTAFTATEFTIADPADPGTLDVSGFDSAAPKLLADFARGDI
jgi:60 kDa SS-A/Ro ribonucleoprotein